MEELTQRIKQRNVITRQSVLNEIVKTANNPDVKLGLSVISLKDPISTLRITVPCRSTVCTHNQCFDAVSFLQLQEMAPTWSCPICNKAISYEALAVDQYVGEILAKVQNADEVTIQPNGEWSLEKDPLNDQIAVSVSDSSLYGRRSAVLPSILDSSNHGREGDSSTLPTSSGTTQLEVQIDKQTRDVEYDDAQTTYSVISAPDDLEKDYIRAFAQRLLQDVESASGVTNISKIPSSYISDTLRAFSWRLHGESSNPFQWGTSVTLHRKRA